MLTPDQQSRKTLYTIAFVFVVIATVLMGWFLIPLLWLIPILITTKKAMDEVGTQEETEHLALGIVCLFLTGIVSGILILVANSNFQNFNPIINQNTESIIFDNGNNEDSTK